MPRRHCYHRVLGFPLYHISRWMRCEFAPAFANISIWWPGKLRLGVPSALTLTLTNPLPIGSTDKTSAFIPEPSMQLSKRVFLASDLSSMHHTVSFDGRRKLHLLDFLPQRYRLRLLRSRCFELLPSHRLVPSCGRDDREFAGQSRASILRSRRQRKRSRQLPGANLFLVACHPRLNSAGLNVVR